MDKIILAFVIIGAVALLIYLSMIRRTIRTLSAQADESWKRLLNLLTDRHRVITLLTDAISSVESDEPSVMALTTATERAESHLASLEHSVPNLDGLSVAEHQSRVRASLDDVTAIVESDSELSSHKSVTGCLKGVTERNERIQLGLSAYNDAAITYTSYVNTWTGSLVAKLTRSPRAYRLLDWVATASSMSLTSSRVPKPAGLMRSDNVPCDDSDAC